MIVDKRITQQIFGCLLKHPQYLGESDKYYLTPNDFQSRFEKFLFSAIWELYSQGAKKISAFDVENCLSTNETAKNSFETNNGIEYLQDVEEFSNEENFPYYYNKLKKFNMLNAYQKIGVDISEFYIEDSFDPRAQEVNEKFEQLTTTDISNAIRKKLARIESEYSKTEEVQSWDIGEEIDGVIDGFGNPSFIGLPVQGKIYSQVINGAERGALTIRSSGSGVGKTRSAVSDACYLAFPFRYNDKTCEWEQIGSSEKILFIMTEQRPEQIMRMIIAYLTGINESRFKYGGFSEEEKILIEQARQIIKEYRDNFHMIRIPNPTIELIKSVVREELLNYEALAVCYDYIFIGPALLGEFRGFNIRNDEALLMFATALKDLAIELDVAVFTSTQVNANADNNTSIRNEASLAGGRSTINKADNGAIMARPTKEELELIQNLATIEPNIVTDVFKVRSGQWSQVRIWSYFDMGTMRKEDLFITNSQMEPINEFFNEYAFDVESWEEGQKQEVIDYIEKLNLELKGDKS